MSLENAYVVLTVVILYGTPKHAGSYRCDGSAGSRLSEGNIGEMATFPWVGVLRVHLHEAEGTKIGLTGLVFIKEKYTIANADDITRIPRHIFIRDSQAMFIPSDKRPWFCKVKDYQAHPEYEFSTLNTIAIVELAFDEDDIMPMTPICLPSYSFNASNQLYVVGYTDENHFLEKVLYKVQHVDLNLCEEFYNRADLTKGLQLPTHYQCGFAENNKENCVWENGMVLASNSTGKWNLIGLSIKGPGCAAPARFISLLPYFPWIESATSLEDYHADFRKFTGSKKKDEIQDIPAHDLFRSNDPRRILTAPMMSYVYPFDVEEFALLNVQRLDKDAILVTRFDTQYERNESDCSNRNKVLVYHEVAKIAAPGIKGGSANYKLSLYDMMTMNYTCVKIKIECLNRSDAYLYYKKYINMKEGAAFGPAGDTPEDILKVFPIEKLQTTKSPFGADIWRPSAKLDPLFIEDPTNNLNVTNVNLWVQFVFKERAVMKFEIYGTAVPYEASSKKSKMFKARRRHKVVNYRRFEKTPQVDNEVVTRVMNGGRRVSYVVPLILLGISFPIVTL